MENNVTLDPKILTTDDEKWYREKAGVVNALYQSGLNYPQWSDERAKYWFESITFFVDHFIKPPLPRPEFHDDWYWWMVRESAYLNLSPRDHAKTTLHSIIKPVWEICCDRNITYFIVFQTTDVAKLILSQIKSQLTVNPRILAGFGVFNPMDIEQDERKVDQDWSQYSITVNRDDFSIKDPTVAVAGSLTNVLSRRVARLVVDDLLNDKIASSQAESERLERWYFNDVQPILLSDGQEIITGTRYRSGDFYGKIIKLSEEGGLYKIFVGDAIINEAAREVLWPERWSYKALMRQRQKMGKTRFNRNYRNWVISDEDSVFPMIWFKGGTDEKSGLGYPGCYDNSLVLGIGPKINKRRWLRYVAIGVDPAIGTSRGSKFFGMVVLGLDTRGQLVIADMVRRQLGFVAQKRLVVEMSQFWKPNFVVVESNSYQKALTEGLGEESRFVPVVPWFTTGSTKHKPDIALPAMDVHFEQGRFRIPRGNRDSEEKTDMLIEELHFWGRHDTSDLAMALWFAFERIRPELERLGILPPLEDMIFGDRRAREQQGMVGVSGHILPKSTVKHIRRMASNAPLSHLSVLAKRKSRHEHRKHARSR
ncbi:MAG: hypothetical protein GF334_04430 [Candidatus Altiarchaeales archaeon]|nr:hypothetical protein [Candidatus Altiarchaeales archaeon]